MIVPEKVPQSVNDMRGEVVSISNIDSWCRVLWDRNPLHQDLMLRGVKFLMLVRLNKIELAED
jgi:hypothetical protein